MFAFALMFFIVNGPLRSGVTPCIVTRNAGFLYNQVSSHASRSPWKYYCVLQPRAISISMQEWCSSFVNMVLRRSHYPYERQRV